MQLAWTVQKSIEAKVEGVKRALGNVPAPCVIPLKFANAYFRKKGQKLLVSIVHKRKTVLIAFSVAMIVLILLAFDFDADSLLTYQELVQTKTNPFQKDTDADGLSDEQELLRGTNPLVSDTDDDGIVDGKEVYSYHTDPLVCDSDYDGLNDVVEVNLGTNPEKKS